LFPLAGNWSIQVKGGPDVSAKMMPQRPAALYPINEKPDRKAQLFIAEAPVSSRGASG
jgi:hypothetical protein